MPLTSSQKALVAQFVQATGANEKTAQRFLKNANYKLDVAADAYFTSNPSPAQVAAASATAANESKLDKMFSDLRSGDDSQNELSAESVMKYASALGVNPEDAGIFVLMELVQAPSLGVITRKGFVEGWKLAGVSPTKTAQKDHIQKAIVRLRSEADLFKRVYRYTFVAGKESPEQRAIALENAVVYWQCLFAKPPSPGRSWESAKAVGGSRQSIDWLALWIAYLEKNWTRTVSKDMWNQTLEFAVKSSADPTLGFWSPAGAWPSVIDSFVEHVRSQGIGLAGGPAASMEVD